ncbi:MAG: hypothetical protein AAFS10_17250, partial [Myxococcota bacterium]
STQGQLSEALTVILESLDLYTKHSHRVYVAQMHWSLSTTYFMLGELNKAHEHAQQCTMHMQAMGLDTFYGISSSDEVLMLIYSGKLDAARARLGEVEQMATVRGWREVAVQLQMHQGLIDLFEHEPHRAFLTLERASQHLERLDDSSHRQIMSIELQLRMAQTELALGRAREACTRLETLQSEHLTSYTRAVVQGELARGYLDQGQRRARAKRLVHEALDSGERRTAQIPAQLQMARIEWLDGNPAQARARLERLRGSLVDGGAAIYLPQVDDLLRRIERP